LSKEIDNNFTLPIINTNISQQVNALSDLHHPTQALADLLTMYERFSHLKGLNVAWVGDGNNVLSSLLIACATMRMNLVTSTPVDYAPCVDAISLAEKMADINGTRVVVSTEPAVAVKGADVVITYTWVGMGNHSQSNQVLVINLTIVIHIQVIVTFFSFFIVKSYSSHFQKKSYFLVDYVNN
jgi:ornithine carbamoyltransferase